MARRRKHWGWGYEDEQPDRMQLRAQGEFLASHLGFGSPEPDTPSPLPELPAPRLRPPDPLRSICLTDSHTRARHALGSSYRDVVRGFRGQFDAVPDLVMRPRDERECSEVLGWATGAGAAVIPYGGGTSVVGGVEPLVADRFEGVVTLALSAMNRVLEVDPISRSARIQAGALGPHLEDGLGQKGMTLRHYPQSFQFSTLGGWIATRAAGHFSTLLTHIDDLVESVRALSAAGVWESRRLPGSGAGISPDRMLIGSEGILGVITEAWVRVRPRPIHRSAATVRFPDFLNGAEAVRAISQSDLHPAACRLIDPLEARLTGGGGGDDDAALLVLGFESSDHEVQWALDRALELCREHGGAAESGADQRGGGASEWRSAFLQAPYLRDTLVAMGVLSETFETAITWERFPEFYRRVSERSTAAVREVCGAGTVTCRFTHVYPDGPAPYFTVLAPSRPGAELEQWAQIKAAASEALLEEGGTITHHHAVGRDHRPWYDRQRPEPFALALRAAKAALDPEGALNPGVLIDP